MFIQKKTDKSAKYSSRKNYKKKSKLTAKKIMRKIIYKLLSPESGRIVLVCAFLITCVSICLTSINYIDNNSLTGYVPSVQMEKIEYASTNKIFTQYQPKVNVKVNIQNQEQLVCNTPQLTVGEFIDKFDIDMDENDEINHPLDSIVNEDMEIKIDTIEYKEITLKEEIPHKVEIVGVQTLPKGKKKVLQTGENGVSTRVLNQKYVNGELEDEIAVSEQISKKPQPQIIQEGIGGTISSPSGKSYSYSHYIDVSATAYGDGTGVGDGPGIAASGKPVKLGVIAVDPRVINLGSKVYVTGNYGDYGVCYAEDTGGGIKGNRIDIYLGNEEIIRQFGRRNMRVYILN